MLTNEQFDEYKRQLFLARLDENFFVINEEPYEQYFVVKDYEGGFGWSDMGEHYELGQWWARRAIAMFPILMKALSLAKEKPLVVYAMPNTVVTLEAMGFVAQGGFEKPPRPLRIYATSLNAIPQEHRTMKMRMEKRG